MHRMRNRARGLRCGLDARWAHRHTETQGNGLAKFHRVIGLIHTS